MHGDLVQAAMVHGLEVPQKPEHMDEHRKSYRARANCAWLKPNETHGFDPVRYDNAVIEYCSDACYERAKQALTELVEGALEILVHYGIKPEEVSIHDLINTSHYSKSLVRDIAKEHGIPLHRNKPGNKILEAVRGLAA